jgi:hypothetical protein
MSLPEQIRVKISSEAIESAGMTAVVSQEMALEELVRMMLGVTGKDAERVRQILHRGSLVSGASRFRWAGIEAGERDVAEFLKRYPDSDPSIRFDAARCYQIVIRGPRQPLVLEREAGEKRRMFQGSSFWGAVMEFAAGAAYVEYSYRERADMFRVRLGGLERERIREAAKLLAFSTYEKQIRDGGVESIELFVKR